MDTFKHKPIDLDRPAFRLLQLLKGSGPDIECNLIQAYFDSDNMIPYEALSYTWASLENLQPIQINGRTLRVTQNLYSALRHLRVPDMDRILWVDAICIDQQNEKEQGHQVQQMGDIYSKASEVIIWLGQATYNTIILMDSLKSFWDKSAQQICGDWDATGSHWKALWSSAQPDPRDQDSDLAIRQREGMKLLLNRSWFERVWVLQEVANAKRASVCCGPRSISANLFALAPILLDLKPSDHCQAVLDIMPGLSRKISWWNQKRDLYTLLLKFKRSKATKPQDRIYALLGISSDARDNLRLRADYTKKEHQVTSDAISLLFGVSDDTCSTISGFLDNFDSLNQASLCTIAKSCNTSDLKSFLEQRGDRVKITKEVIEATEQNIQNGPEVLKVLLAKRDDDNCIVLYLLAAAARNSQYGKDIMDKILEQNKDTNYISNIFNTATKKANRGEDSPKLCSLQRGGDTFQAVAWSEKDMIKFPFEQRRGKLEITAQVAEAAAGNEECGKEMMELLLNNPGVKVQITKAVLEAVLANTKSGGEILNLLLKYRENEVHKIGTILKDVIRNTQSGREILTEQESEAQVTLVSAKGVIRNHGRAGQGIEQENKANTIENTVKMAASRYEERWGPMAQDVYITGFPLEFWRGKKKSWHFQITRRLLKSVIEQQKDDIDITKKVIKAAVGDWRRRRAIIELLFQLQKPEARIIEQHLEVEISDHRCRKMVLELLLEPQQGKVKITGKILEAVARNCGREILEFLLEERGDEVKITMEVLVAAARNEECGKEVLEFILKEQGGQVKITEELLIAATLNRRSGKKILELLLKERRSEVEITEGVLEVAAINSGEVLQLLLKERAGEVDITRVLIAATYSMWCRKEDMELILKEQRGEVEITKGLLEAAARNCRRELLEFLLEERGGKVEITKEMLKAAAGNNNYGREVLELLLKERSGEVEITKGVLEAAARNCRLEVLEFLLLEKRGNKVKITEEMLKAAAENIYCGREVLQLLLKEQQEGEVKITKEVLKAAAGNNNYGREVLEFLLLEERGNKVKITEEMLKVATDNLNSGPDILQILLKEQQGGKVKITKEVLKVAADNRSSGPDILKLLLKEQRGKVKITKEVLKVAAGNRYFGRDMLKILLEETIEEEVLEFGRQL